MTADLDTLLTALYVCADDLLPRRPRARSTTTHVAPECSSRKARSDCGAAAGTRDDDETRLQPAEHDLVPCRRAAREHQHALAGLKAARPEERGPAARFLRDVTRNVRRAMTPSESTNVITSLSGEVHSGSTTSRVKLNRGGTCHASSQGNDGATASTFRFQRRAFPSLPVILSHGTEHVDHRRPSGPQ